MQVGRSTKGLSGLQTIIGLGRADSVIAALEPAVQTYEQTLLASLPDHYLTVMQAGGNIAARALRGPDSGIRAAKAPQAKIDYSFDTTNTEAVAWARREAGKLVTNVSADTRRAVQQLVTRAFTERIPPRRLAVMLRSVVGLNYQQVDALANLHVKLLEARGKVVRAGSLRFRVPKRGYSDAQIERAVTRYAEKLHRARALTIARTETMRAANEGQRQLWKQAVQHGDLPRGMRREWIVADPCPICAELEGRTATLDGQFPGGISGPPAHPNCKCTTGLRDA